MLSKIGKEEIVFKSEQLQAVRHMYDGRDSYTITTWQARLTVYSIKGVTEYFAHAQTVYQASLSLDTWE